MMAFLMFVHALTMVIVLCRIEWFFESLNESTDDDGNDYDLD